jgi:hypothetical protein
MKNGVHLHYNPEYNRVSFESTKKKYLKPINMRYSFEYLDAKSSKVKKNLCNLDKWFLRYFILLFWI